jgi:dTDP-4-dehydrorhamnose reductase
MKILVTGSTGQLGSELVRMLRADGVDVTGIGSMALDYCQPQQVREWVSAFKADWVINCAAYTHVDMAEQESDKVFLINRDATRALAEGVQSYAGRLMHISTDFIFDGKQSHPYSEDAPPNPLGIYGQSKLEGERAVLDLLPDATIMRTAWVYGETGNNFVKTMLKFAAERTEIKVIDDQIGSPTWTWDAAKAIYELLASDACGIYHFTNEGVASWYDLATEVVSVARRLGYPVKTSYVRPIPACEYKALATRPAYSVLSKRKIRSALNYQIPHWRDSLGEMLTQLQKTK